MEDIHYFRKKLTLVYTCQTRWRFGCNGLGVFYCFMKSISSLFCSWLIVPFQDKGCLTANQKKFNKAHSSLRQTVQRAIGLLKGRWRKVLYLDHLDVKLMAKLIMAACVLHNFCLMLDDYDNSYFLPGDGNNADDDDGGDAGLRAIQQQRIAEGKRNDLMDVLCM